MRPLRTLVLKFSAHLACCLLFLYLFSTNAMLRPTACFALHKEVFIGILVIVMVYLNAYFLQPLLFRRNRISLYVLLSLSSALVAVSVEFALMHNDIMSNIVQYMSLDEAKLYFWMRYLFCLLRNLALVAATFMVCELRSWSKRGNMVDTILSKEEDGILAEDMDKNTILVRAKDIRYFVQDRNYTKFFCERDKFFFRYGSLKSTLRLMEGKPFVQVNRNTVIRKDLVCFLEETGQVSILSEQTFEVPEIYIDKVMAAVSETNDKKDSKIQRKRRNQQSPPKRNNERVQQIYQSIAKAPGVSAVTLSRNTEIPIPTVNRILGQLKKEGLIEYQGSKKYGGYRVVES